MIITALFLWFFYISSSEDKTINWKTYKNEEYGFEIKYPQDYLYEENTFIPRKEIVYFFPPENKSDYGFEPEIFISVDKEPRVLSFHGTFSPISRPEALNSPSTLRLISSEDI